MLFQILESKTCLKFINAERARSVGHRIVRFVLEAIRRHFVAQGERARNRVGGELLCEHTEREILRGENVLKRIRVPFRSELREGPALHAQSPGAFNSDARRSRHCVVSELEVDPGADVGARDVRIGVVVGEPVDDGGGRGRVEAGVGVEEQRPEVGHVDGLSGPVVLDLGAGRWWLDAVAASVLEAADGGAENGLGLSEFLVGGRAVLLKKTKGEGRRRHHHHENGDDDDETEENLHVFG